MQNNVSQNLLFLNDLKHIDENYFKVMSDSKQSQLFYALIEKNIEFANKIFFQILNYTDVKTYANSYINHISEHIPNYDYSENRLVNNKKKISIAIITCSIIWAFNETTEYKNINVEKNLLPHDSYNLINYAIDFINMFKMWNSAHNKEIILNFINRKDHNANLYRIFTILLHHGIIKKEIIFVKWLKAKKICFWTDNFNWIKILKIHTKSLEYIKIKNNSILLGEHYSFCWELFIPNKNNDSVFELKKDDVIRIMSKEFTNIDFCHFREIVDLYFNEHGLNKISLNLDYFSYLKEYRLAIKQNNLNLVSLLGKKLSIYQKAIELETILNTPFNENEKFFLPWNYDFRGRTYYLSDISFTFHKEFRWCMYKEHYKTIDDFKPLWHIFNTRIFKKLNEFVDELKNLNILINNDSIYLKQAIIWMLISLGEVNKTKLGKKIHILTFIREGIKIFNQKDQLIKMFNYDDKLKILTIIKIINEFSKDINEGWIKKRLVSKDAPASVFQHLVLNFGWKEEETLKIVNLRSEDTWYDIYSILIDDWKKTKINLSRDDYQILNLFTRKSLKKIIMTSNYGVGYKSAETYFKNELSVFQKSETEKEKENFNKFLNDNWRKIEIFLEDFFNFLSNLLIVKNNPNDIIDYILSNDGFLMLSDALIDLNYYEKEKYTVDIQYEAKRYTKLFSTISNEKNFNKFKIAARANYIHSLDAALTRWIIAQYGIFTIHDCFLVDPANITYLVSLVNEGMGLKFDSYNKENRDFNIEIFSIFIVI